MPDSGEDDQPDDQFSDEPGNDETGSEPEMGEDETANQPNGGQVDSDRPPSGQSDSKAVSFEQYSSDLDNLIDSSWGEPLESMFADISTYDDAPQKSDVVQNLMTSCDDLMSSLTDHFDDVPAAFKDLDDQLWEWFKEPPEPAELRRSMASFFDQVWDEITISSGSGASDQFRDEQTDGDSNDKTDVEESVTEQTNEATEPSGDELIEELDVDTVVAEDFLMEANDQLEMLNNQLVEIEDDPNPDSLEKLFRSMHTLKGGFGMLGLETCTSLTHAAEDLLGQLQESPPDQVPAVWIDLFFETMDSLKLILGTLEECIQNDESTLKIPLSQEFVQMLEQDLHKARDGETDEEAFGSTEAKEASEGDQDDVGEETVTIALDQVAEMVDLVGELVISNSELREQLGDSVDRKIDNTVNQQEKILDQLQRESMNMRMLPLKKEFKKLPRIVRDLSRELDKEVDLEITGADTEIDKSVLDSLQGPLLHLVRNAMDHGIETPEVRREKGKDPEGRLEIRAYHESGHVYIEIEEDGAGINRDAVLNKAIEQGMVGEDDELEPDEIDRLIMQPGFSTTDDVSDVSGRGVGMDVVSREIEQLRGALYIDSEPDEGSKFTIELPLTVAIIDGLIVRLKGERMIFPVNQVVKSIHPEPGDLQWLQGEGQVVNTLGSVIPVIDPGDVLKGSPESEDQLNKRTVLVVVQSQQGQYAIPVDSLVSHEQIVIKNLKGKGVQKTELVSGAAILGDGSVGLIIDVIGLIRNYEQGTLDSVPRERERQPAEVS